MKILDNIATKIADKVNAKNDEVMLLEQENDSLRQKLAASELTVSDYQKKIKKKSDDFVSANTALLSAIKENERLESKYTEVKKRLKDLSESGERQVDVIQEYSERILELEEQLSKRSSKELKRQIDELIRISEN